MVLSSCAPGQQDLVGTTWILEQDEGATGLIETEVTLEFKNNGEVTGFYSHLNYKGLYQVEDERLTIDDICWLSLICQAETNMSAPQEYIEALMNAERYVIEDDTLSIHTSADELTFTTLG